MNKSIINRILIFTIIALILEFIFTIGIFKWKMSILCNNSIKKFTLYDRKNKETKLKDEVNVAYNIIKNYYEQSKDIDSLKQAKTLELKKIIDIVSSEILELKNKKMPPMELKEIIRNQRFGYNRNYIFILDTNGKIILNPIKPQLEGKGSLNFKDKKGKYLFKEMIDICKKQGEGMVDYYWPKPGHNTASLKISYVKLIPQMNWIIGTGEWIDDITAQMKIKAMQEIGKIRLSGGNYFWINNMTPIMLVHPSKKLRGRYVGDLKDKNGKKMMLAMVDVCKKYGEGFVTYYWG